MLQTALFCPPGLCHLAMSLRLFRVFVSPHPTGLFLKESSATYLIPRGLPEKVLSRTGGGWSGRGDRDGG